MSKRRQINTMIRDNGGHPTGKPHTVRMDSRGRPYGIMDNGEWRRITVTRNENGITTGTFTYKGELHGVRFSTPGANPANNKTQGE